MVRNVVKVVRKEQVRVGGKVHVPAQGPQAPVGGADSTEAPGHASVPQQARVMESNSDYAILEVVCSCGATMHIQCHYGHVTQNQ